MTEQQQHLIDLLNQQKQLINEINELNMNLTNKRDMLLKVQGVLEYLSQIGIVLPETDTTNEESQEELGVESEEI